MHFNQRLIREKMYFNESLTREKKCTSMRDYSESEESSPDCLESLSGELAGCVTFTIVFGRLTPVSCRSASSPARFEVHGFDSSKSVKKKIGEF